MFSLSATRHKYVSLETTQDLEGAQGASEECPLAPDLRSDGALNGTLDSPLDHAGISQRPATTTKRTGFLALSLLVYVVSVAAVHVLRTRLDASCLELMEVWSLFILRCHGFSALFLMSSQALLRRSCATNRRGLNGGCVQQDTVETYRMKEKRPGRSYGIVSRSLFDPKL